MPREQASRSLMRDTPTHRLCRSPCREQHTMTRQRNTMKRRLAIANWLPNFISAATTRSSAITPTWHTPTICTRSSMQKKPPRLT